MAPHMKHELFNKSNIRTLLDAGLSERIRAVPKLFGWMVLVIGVLTLLGWLFHITALKSISPDFVSMKPNTAFGLVFSAVSLLLFLHHDDNAPIRRLSRIIGAIVAFI